MINLIEKFLDDTSKMKIFSSEDKRNDYQEVYFFMGRDSVLCINKRENKVLYEMKLSQLQINIISSAEFALCVNGQSIFFLQSDDLVHNKAPQNKVIHIEDEKESPIKKPKIIIDGSDSQYVFKAFCDKCSSKRCAQYDTLNGRKFNFGDAQVSEDMMQQYDKYCQTKILKLNCAEIVCK